MLLNLAIVNLSAMSYNNAYPTNKFGRRYLRQEGKDFHEIIKLMLAKYMVKEKIKLPDLEVIKFYSLNLIFGLKDFYLKDGKRAKRKDASNFIKLCEDAVSDFLGIDDKYNVFVSSTKIPSEKEFVAIKLEEQNISELVKDSKLLLEDMVKFSI